MTVIVHTDRRAHNSLESLGHDLRVAGVQRFGVHRVHTVFDVDRATIIRTHVLGSDALYLAADADVLRDHHAGLTWNPSFRAGVKFAERLSTARSNIQWDALNGTTPLDADGMVDLELTDFYSETMHAVVPLGSQHFGTRVGRTDYARSMSRGGRTYSESTGRADIAAAVGVSTANALRDINGVGQTDLDFAIVDSEGRLLVDIEHTTKPNHSTFVYNALTDLAQVNGDFLLVDINESSFVPQVTISTVTGSDVQFHQQMTVNDVSDLVHPLFNHIQSQVTT